MPARKTVALRVETSKKQDVVKGKQEEQQPLSPGPLSPPLYLKEDKDTLAYEHDRQKSKKTLDRARNKAKKAFGWGGHNSTAGRLAEGKAKSSSGNNAKKVEAGEEEKELAREFTPSTVQAAKPQGTVYGGTPFTEVTLVDLVLLATSDGNSITRKKKGAAGKGGLDGEFEVIPHVRSVIVLDEQFVGPDVGPDDAWECIEDESSEEESSEKKTSKATYARVAAAAFKEAK